ncbi:MAG: TolC family protein [Bryobacteraceae bacterium]
MKLAHLLWICAVPLAAQGPLQLDEVLDAVEKNYPPLLATLAEKDIADAEVLQALGRFDLILGAQADSDRLGYYENQRVTLGFDQPLTTWGASTYGGWRTGQGDYAAYDGKNETRSLGEWRGGVRVPLLRNRAIDDRRGNLQKAQVGRRIADLSVDTQRLIVRQLAARRYWDWAASGQRLRVAEEVLRVAEERDAALREASQLGQLPAIEVTENRRQILQRRAQLVEAERGLQLATIDLSLFYRSASGEPELVDRSRLPQLLPETSTLTDVQVEEDRRRALTLRPEISRLTEQKQQARVDINLAENERKPAVDLGLGFTSESGEGPIRRGPNELKASLRFELPFQRRTATGKLRSAQAKLSQLEQRERFAADQVVAEVRDAASAVRAAHDRAKLAKDEVVVALDLADAERERFRLGDSTLFTVNLREQAAVEAELRSVNAVSDYLRAYTTYQQVTASLLATP